MTTINASARPSRPSEGDIAQPLRSLKSEIRELMHISDIAAERFDAVIGLHFRRETIEEWIERLIALLDEMDGDPDLEDSADDEPSIGSHCLVIGGELAHDLEFDTADDEATMGWSNPMGLRIHDPKEALQMLSLDSEEGLIGGDGSGNLISKRLPQRFPT